MTITREEEGATVTLVINAKYAPKGWRTNPAFIDVRRNRAGRLDGNPRNRGGLGNPFPLSCGFELSDSLELCREYIENRVRRDPQFRAVVAGMYGRTLVCACAPKGGVKATDPHVCHAQIYAEISAKLRRGTVV